MSKINIDFIKNVLLVKYNIFIEFSLSPTTKSDAIAISQIYKATNEVIVVEIL